MQYIKTSQLKPGMRLARPVYNKQGVMLYERDASLSASIINSIEKFGIWGIYILEPAEPLPPLTKEDLVFEQFQTVGTFQLREDFELLLNDRPPKNLFSLSQKIIRTFGSLEHKINFSKTLRSNDDCVYKHCLNTAILSAMMAQKLRYPYPEQNAIVCAALVHDLGMLIVPEEMQEKGSSLLSPDERRYIRSCMEKGYHFLHPDFNDYKLPDTTLKLVLQMVHSTHNAKSPKEKRFSFHNGSYVLHTAGMFDDLTSMNLERAPVSDLAAIRFLRDYPDYYPIPFVTALTKCLHILPSGCCIDLSNGQKGIVLEENHKNFSQPVVILFSTNQRIDFSADKFQKTFHIKDVMKTMDERIPVDTQTLKRYKSDPHTAKMAEHFLRKKS